MMILIHKTALIAFNSRIVEPMTDTGDVFVAIHNQTMVDLFNFARKHDLILENEKDGSVLILKCGKTGKEIGAYNQ